MKTLYIKGNLLGRERFMKYTIATQLLTSIILDNSTNKASIIQVKSSAFSVLTVLEELMHYESIGESEFNNKLKYYESLK